MPSLEQVTAAISTIDQLSGWLENAGLSAAAIAQFKFNALATMYPELKEVAELAKQLIGAAHPVPEVGMSVTELAQVLTERLGTSIKPEQVNKALVALGYQERDEAKRIWKLTDAGQEHGTTLLATSTTNAWTGTQLKWHRSVIPILENYFQPSTNSADILSPSDEGNGNGTASKRTNASSKAPSKKTWTIAERLKESGIKSNSAQIELMQSFADEFYQEQFGTTPPKLPGRKASTSSYPLEAIELVDRAIQTVLNPKKKSESL